ncbi:HAMP domain-containing sensor histidine kinase (plasmid) [Deinococcus radiomollis]|uniref:sensor histidine kinase n=1 Tax=Deinococcus radiomollis TaxID=468916 RepID=UPI003891F05F
MFKRQFARLGQVNQRCLNRGQMSLRVRLTIGYALIFSVCILLGALGVYLAAGSTLLHSLDATLHETASVAQASIGTVRGKVSFVPALRPTGDLTIELLTPNGTLIQEVGLAEEAVHLPLTPGLASTRDRRVLTLEAGNGLLLRVSGPADTLTEITETLGKILSVGSLLMILVSCAAGYFLADRALRPVDEVVRTADQIAESGQYLDRVPQAPGTDEMARLTGTVNRMLDRLSGTIDREKEFARIAAHELRTPLTAIKGRLDLALERPRDNETYQKTLSVMRSRVNTLVRLSEGLLELARSDAPLNMTAVELGGAALSTAEAQREAFLAAGKRLELDVEESWVSAEIPGVQQVIQNLLENALKYGGSQVRVRVSGGVLEIQDSGPGPDRAQWERLLRPFERGAALQSVPGSGLGLALVLALSRRWGVHLEPSWNEAGFMVRLKWMMYSAKA